MAIVERCELDDTRLYAAYLLRHRADDMRRALGPLGPVDGTALATTVHATFDALAALPLFMSLRAAIRESLEEAHDEWHKCHREAGKHD